ncbi:MAG: phenylacetate--CoA ligase family protein [bacterium]
MTTFFHPTEALPRAEWDRLMAERLRGTVAHAYARTAAGRRAVDAAGGGAAFRGPDDLVRLPLLRKGSLPALQSADPPFGGWNALPVDRLRRVFVSPGPIYDPEGPAEDYWGFAPALHAAGFQPGDLVLNTFAYHLTPAGHMFDGALGVLGCAVIPGGVGNTEAQIRTARELRPRGYIGTPSFLATLLEKMDGEGPFRVAFVSGEILTATLRADLERREVRVSQGYATADVGLIAHECERRDGLHLSDRVFVEIVDPESGQPAGGGEAGEVVVTFLSEVYPLLRLATGDLSALDLGSCPCGRGSPRLSRMRGRVGDAVKVRGMFLHPNEVALALAGLPQVRRYQLAVTRDAHQDRLTARVELAEAAEETAATAVADRLREITRLRAEVEILPPGTLPEGAAPIVDERQWD